MSPLDLAQLALDWQDLLKHNPRVRIRDAAHKLNSHELCLQLTQLDASASLLDVSALQLLKSLSSFGQLMTLVRNEQAVSEKTGKFAEYQGSDKMGLFLGDMDQRLFLSHWQYFLHVKVKDRDSIQVFDAAGDAVIKIFVNEQTQLVEFQAFLKQHKAKKQSAQAIELEPVKALPEFSQQVDSDKLARRWAKLTDVHQFFILLKKLNISRQQAFTDIAEPYAQSLPLECLPALFEKIAEQKVSVINFVSNAGAIQIHTGVFEKIVMMQQWINVFNHNFTLHFLQENIASVWLIRRPSAHGILSSIEVIDHQGKTLLQLFGERQEDKPEQEAWRQLLTEFERFSVADSEQLTQTLLNQAKKKVQNV